MSKNNSGERGVRNQSGGMLKKNQFTLFTFAFLLFACALSACRYDMQDQPRYKAYRQSTFFGDNRASRDLPEGTVARGLLRENKAFYTGKKETTGSAPAPAATSVDANGNTVVTSFPDAIEEFPVPVTQELIERGEERYRVFCMMCHGPTGNGDGMIVRRGFSKPPTYNDDRLRGAPVGHFFDVITNGYGKMNAYASMVPVADRWAIVAYIRALQVRQNPNGAQPGTTAARTNAANATATGQTATGQTATGQAATTGGVNTGGVSTGGANTSSNPNATGSAPAQGGVR